MSEQTTEEKVASRLYELAYLVSPHVPEDKLGEVVTRIKSTLEKQGVFVLFDEFPKHRALAYTLVKSIGGKNEKYSNAYFGWMRFEADAVALAEINKGFEKDTDVIRFLLVKADHERKTTTRAAVWRRDAPKREPQKVEGVKAPSMTEAEIDKTIEELIAE